MHSEEAITLLVAAGVGTFKTNIFGSTQEVPPSGDGPWLSVIETGGTSPEHTHNSVTVPAYSRPGLQIVVRASKHLTARSMARKAWFALNIRNRYVNRFAQSITITRSGTTATATAATDHEILDGGQVVISGATQAEYNGTFDVTVTGATTFTFTVTGTPATPATGTIVATPQIWYKYIRPVQEPFDAGSDSTGRPWVKFNVESNKRPS